MWTCLQTYALCAIDMCIDMGVVICTGLCITMVMHIRMRIDMCIEMPLAPPPFLQTLRSILGVRLARNRVGGVGLSATSHIAYRPVRHTSHSIQTLQTLPYRRCGTWSIRASSSLIRTSLRSSDAAVASSRASCSSSRRSSYKRNSL